MIHSGSGRLDPPEPALPDHLNDLLAESDFVVLALPLNETTHAMIGAEALAKMKPGAVLVNVARGSLVVTADLVAALQSGRLAGAVLDVTDPEPLPAESKLWEMPNVIITPHVGGQSARRIDNMTRLFCENLTRRAASRPLINLLTDKRLGFPIRGAGVPLWVDFDPRP